MCGIVGIHGPQDDAWVDAMNARIVHRGPDGDGVYRDRDAGLAMAMRRLCWPNRWPKCTASRYPTPSAPARWC